MHSSPVLRLDFRTSAGVRYAQVVDFSYLSATIEVNAPGFLEVGLSGKHPVIQTLSDDDQIEVWRKDPRYNLGWYRWFGGIFQRKNHERPNREIFMLTCPEYKAFLKDRVVAYPAGKEGLSQFTNVKAETIMKTLVSYNLGAQALTSNGRLLNGVKSGIVIETDAAGGNTLATYGCFGKELLRALQEVKERGGGGDFDLVKTGPAEFTFRFYPGQLGTDRTTGPGAVTFSVDKQNMGHPIYEVNRIHEKSVVIAGGEDQGEDRKFGFAYSASYNYSTNHREAFYNASSTEEANLSSDATKRLTELQKTERFRFLVKQTKGSAYEVHYKLGDLVKVINPFSQAASIQKITSATITKERGKKEEVFLETETP